MPAFIKYKSIYFIALIYFILTYFVALDWFLAGYFKINDVFFSADPTPNLWGFAQGWGRHSIIHAFVECLSIPFRAISTIAYHFNLIDNEKQFRLYLGLMVSPLASALNLIAFYNIMHLMKLKPFQKLTLTLIFSISFTSLIFSLVPETYAISALLITVLIGFYTQELYSGVAIKNIYWISIGILLTGTTLSNLCLFFIIYGFSLYTNKELNLYRAFFTSLLWSLIIFAFVLLFYEASHLVLQYPKGQDEGVNFVVKYTTKSLYDGFNNLITLGSVSISSFFPTQVHVEQNILCLRENIFCNKITFQSDSISIMAYAKFLLFSLFLYFAYKASLKNEKWNKLCLLSLGIIAYNFLLHIFYGDEMFLYVQHWITALTLLLIPLLTKKKHYLFSFIVVQILCNLYFFLTLHSVIAMKL